MYEESVLWDGMREVLRGGGELTGGWLTVGRVRRQELGGKDTRVFAFSADVQHLVTAVRPVLTHPPGPGLPGRRVLTNAAIFGV